MHFDELVRLLVRKACERGQEDGRKTCSSTKPSTKIQLDAPNGGTITVDLGVALSGWVLFILEIIALIVLKLVGCVQFNFGRAAGHRLGGRRFRRDDGDDKVLPPRALVPATAPIAAARPMPLPAPAPALPTPAARPVSLPLGPIAAGACPVPDDVSSMRSATSMRSIASGGAVVDKFF